MNSFANRSDTFDFLSQEVKNKAIEITSLLIGKGLESEQAQRIAVSNTSCCNFNAKENNDIHLIPHTEGWALISVDAIIFHFICASRNEALGKARNKAKSEKLKLFIHALDGSIIDAESFKVNRPLPAYIQRTVEENNVTIKTEAEGRSLIFYTRREALRKARILTRKASSELFKGNIERNFSFEL